MVGDSPAVSKWWIGVALQRIREASGRKRQEMADRLGKARAWPGHIEIGRNLPTAGDVEVLLTWYGRADLVSVFRDELRIAKQRDWWHDHAEVVAEPERLRLGLEVAAEAVDSYAVSAVPEFLRVPGYASALFQDSRHVAEFQAERRLELMAERQKRLLDNTNTQIRIILSEIALRQLVGDSEVMAAQIRYLMEVAQRPNVTLRVLPLSASTQPGADAAFTMFKLPEKFADDVASVVHLDSSDVYYQENTHLETYELTFSRLIDDAATVEESIELLKQMVEFFNM